MYIIYIYIATCVQFVSCFFEASVPYVVSGDQLLVGARLGTDFARFKTKQRVEETQDLLRGGDGGDGDGLMWVES